MSSPAFGIQTGSIMGTGSAIEIRTLHFRRPMKIWLVNTDGDHAEWSATCPDASALVGEQAVAGEATTFETSGGITPQDSGFDIGTTPISIRLPR